MTTRREFLQSLPALGQALGATAAPQQIQITDLDNLPIRPERPPIYFVSPHCIVRGLSHGTPGQFVQLLTRRRDRGWVIGTGVATPRRSTGGLLTWALPLDIEDGPQTVAAILVDEPMPAGLVVTGARWLQLIAQSESFEVSSEGFERSRLRILEVGGQVPVSGDPVPVGAFEEIRIRTEGLPLGCIINTLIEPADGDRVWVGDRLHVTRDLILWANGYFGSSIGDASAKGERDIHAPFWLSCVATALPLPRRIDGITPREWLALNRFIRAASPKVSLVRAILPTQAEIRITKLGLSNDGVRYLAPRYTRIEGLFAAGQRYRPLRPEIITLLTRAADSSGRWTVAGATNLKGNRAVFTISAADLLPTNASAERDSLIAIAVASYVPFDPTRPVTEADIGARQFALSKEVHYRLMASRRQP